ncbi:MAG: hypothetical protein ACLQVX_13115 [Limisphaerales bacterium]
MLTTRKDITTKPVLGMAILAAMLAAGSAYGATNVTLQAQTVTLALKATVQGPVTAGGSTRTTASLATKDVIAALGKAVGTNFSAAARLVLISSPTNSWFSVQDVVSKQTVNFPVSANVTLVTSDTVTQITTSMSGQATGTIYGVSTLQVRTPTLSMTLYGYSSESFSTTAITSSGFGYGLIGGNTAIFKGAVNFSPMKLQ